MNLIYFSFQFFHFQTSNFFNGSQNIKINKTEKYFSILESEYIQIYLILKNIQSSSLDDYSSYDERYTLMLYEIVFLLLSFFDSSRWLQISQSNN